MHYLKVNLNAEIVNVNLNTDEKKDLENLINIAINKIEENILIISIDKKKYSDFKKINKIKISKNIKTKKEKILSKLDNIKYDESINSEYTEILNKFENFKYNKKKIFDDNKHDNYFLVLSNNVKLDFYLNHDNGKLAYAFHNSKKSRINQ